MSAALAAIADPGKLGRVVLYSLVAGVGISAVLALAVSCAGGLLDALRERRTAVAVAWGTLGAVCAVIAIGAAAFGVIIMAAK